MDPSISVNETDTYLPYEEGIQNDVFIKNIDGSDILYQKQWPDYPNITTNDSWPVGEQTNVRQSGNKIYNYTCHTLKLKSIV